MHPVLAAEVLGLLFVAVLLSATVRRAIRWTIRRMVRRAAVGRGLWRRRLPRLAEAEDVGESRRIQRADAAARMLSYFSTAVIFAGAAIGALQVTGIDPVYAISSAGFVGLAIALSGQELIKNIIVGTLAVLEDRYAVGDEILVRHDGADLRGVIDLVGAASVRVRLGDGGTWYAGHSKLEAVTNLSQRLVSTPITLPTEEWEAIGDAAGRRLASASDDHGLTGIVFLPELIERHSDGQTTTLELRSNRPLTAAQQREVERRLRVGSSASS